ncbi:MAG: hypothetical protein J4F28_08715, partial [Nitrosopumilaceae archaeon]|nr:hypothetical protein [Nitrosopumilaceae archaeon]
VQMVDFLHAVSINEHIFEVSPPRAPATKIIRRLAVASLRFLVHKFMSIAIGAHLHQMQPQIMVERTLHMLRTDRRLQHKILFLPVPASGWRGDYGAPARLNVSK